MNDGAQSPVNHICHDRYVSPGKIAAGSYAMVSKRFCTGGGMPGGGMPDMGGMGDF